MKQILFLVALGTTIWQAQAQTDPYVDRPVQQCIANHKDKVSLDANFSIASWLGRVVSNCEKLQASTGKGGGPQVVALLQMEKDLDELILMSDNCPILGNAKVKEALLEMKKVYQEKQKNETFKKANANTDVFGESDELTELTLTRGGAGKIKNQAEKIRKNLKR